MNRSNALRNELIISCRVHRNKKGVLKVTHVQTEDYFKNLFRAAFADEDFSEWLDEGEGWYSAKFHVETFWDDRDPFMQILSYWKSDIVKPMIPFLGPEDEMPF